MMAWLMNMCEKVKEQISNVKHRLGEMLYSSYEGYSVGCADCGYVVVVGHSYEDALKYYEKNNQKAHG